MSPQATMAGPPPLTRTERIVRFLIEELDGVVMLLSAILIGLANLGGKYEHLFKPALIAIAVALAIRVFRMKYQLHAVLEKVASDADDVRGDFDSLRRMLESDRLHEAERCDRPSFYRHMLAALRDARETVDLTQLDAQPPSHFGTREMVEYFELQKHFVHEHPDMRFRRILAIPTLEKLDWVTGVLMDAKDCPNFQLRVIDISRSGDLPPPLSLQIFDRREICMVDPRVSYVVPEDQRHMLWVRGKAVADVMCTYYDEIWGKARPLKEGYQIYWSVLEEIASALAEQHPEKAELYAGILERLQGLAREPLAPADGSQAGIPVST